LENTGNLSEFLSKDTAGSRNEKVFIAIWGIGTFLGEKVLRSLLLYGKNVVQYSSGWECGNKMSECLESREGGEVFHGRRRRANLMYC